MRHQHVLGVERFVELFFGHQLFFEHDVVDRAVGFQGFFGHLRAVFIADIGVQGRHNADGVLHHFVATLLVHGDAHHAFFGQGVDGIAQPPEAFEEAFGDDGLHDVEL